MRDELLSREALNPILTISDWPYAANSVFNPAAVEIDGKTLLLVRVEDKRGVSHLTVARSDDGVTGWEIDARPTFFHDTEHYPEEVWGVEDARVTRLDELDCWAVTYTAYSQGGPLVSLALTRDFKNFERIGAIMPPEDKDAVLFPRRFNGRWAMLHRPLPRGAKGMAHVWLSFSPDLRHWGDHQVMLRAREGSWWDAGKIGVCTPPIETDGGWLVIYHGVRATPSGVIYRLGLALLDIDDPTRVLGRSEEWMFGPHEHYERNGDVPGVVFPCGWIRQGDDLRIYYGAADTSVCLAYGSVKVLLNALREQSHTYRDGITHIGRQEEGVSAMPTIGTDRDASESTLPEYPTLGNDAKT